MQYTVRYSLPIDISITVEADDEDAADVAAAALGADFAGTIQSFIPGVTATATWDNLEPYEREPSTGRRAS
jgi:hypothetical protein